MQEIWPLLWFPPVAWFTGVWTKRIPISLEGDYVRQSLMNRCWIKGPNRILSLTIPVQHSKDKESKEYRFIKIAYQQAWHKEHWRSIEVAYNRSAFFEYISPELKKIWEHKPETLGELSQLSFSFCCNWLRLPEAEWTKDSPTYNSVLFPSSPKPTLEVSESPYFQLYGPFVPGLSILDLLFHENPNEVRQRILTSQ
ncbi:MAG: hypothetical protein EBS07_02310 [Sphingobacteriia bacterium]|nr:hypothetical protein [Sphingobacteriia bacterium]